MPTEAKQAQVAELVEVLSKVGHRDRLGPSRACRWPTCASIRRQLRERDISIRVIKNRLARIAAEQAGRTELVPLLTGPSALVTGGGEETALAKGLLDALRPYRERRGAGRRHPRHHVRRGRRHAARDAAARETCCSPSSPGAWSRRSEHDGRPAGGAAAQPRLRARAAARQPRSRRRPDDRARHHTPTRHTPDQGRSTIAMASSPSPTVLEAIDGMTVLELSDVHQGLRGALRRHGGGASGRGGRGAGRRWRRRGGGRRGAERVLRRPHRGRAQQDPGHQGRPRAHRPGPQGGQGPRRCSPQAGQGRGRERRGREGQGRARGAGRQGRHQVGVRGGRRPPSRMADALAVP